MTVLSDRSIVNRFAEGSLVVSPVFQNALQPNSIDVRLGDVITQWNGSIMDPERDQAHLWDTVPLEDDGRWFLWPHRCYHGVLYERIVLPDDLAVVLFGKSSLGRQHVTIHQTAGLGDAGYQGNLTLEIKVGAPIRMRPRMLIGQLVFLALDQAVERPYGHPTLGSRYQGDLVPTPARIAVPS